MSISQMIIAGSNLSAGGGGDPKSIAWSGIAFEPIQEGQQQTCTVYITNWDGSTAYWSLYDYGGNRLDSQVVGGQAYGELTFGNGYYGSTYFNFTFTADATSEGQLNYAVRIGSSIGSSDYAQQGYFTLRDSSQTPTLVFDLDSANWGNGTWSDTSGNSLNATTSNMGNTTNNGYTVLFNGDTTYASVSGLTNSVYGTITLSAWIKPTVIVDRTQTIIAKELCYKLRLNTNGDLTLGTGKGYAPWEVTATVGAGGVPGGQWSHVVATVDANYTRIYVNGVMVTETSGNIIGANNAAFDIGAYSSDGNATVSDFFYGSMGEVKMWNYSLNSGAVITQYNTTAARYGRTPIPTSLSFNGTQNTALTINGNMSDWAMGSSGTIEWWQKSGLSSSGTFVGGLIAQGGAGETGGIDIFQSNGMNIHLGGNTAGFWPEPAPGVWTHMAVTLTPTGGPAANMKLYKNGKEQTLTNGQTDALLQNSIDTLRIGDRIANVNYQNWTGLITDIHISTATLYSGNFTPMLRTATTTGTVLLLPSTNPKVDLSYHELTGLSASAQNGGTIYFSTSTYPNLINQVQVGNTLSSFNTSTVGTVTGAVFLADPANWGIPVTTVPLPGPYNFSGVRHTTIGTVLTVADVPKLPASGGTGEAATATNIYGTWTVTPSTDGIGNPGTAYPGDTITWTITTNNAGLAGMTMYYWVDGNAVPANTFIENSLNGSLSLDSNGNGTFTRTVAQNVGLQFRMFIGREIYQGGSYPFSGYIGV